MSKKITVTTPECRVCHRSEEMQLDAEKVRQWREGAFIRDVFPGMTANDRELLQSGLHPKCWEILFPEDEDA
jgi:hypothetical protein